MSEEAARLLDQEAAFAREFLSSIDDASEHDKPNWISPRFHWKERAEVAEGLAKQIRALPAQEWLAPESEIIERCAQIAENYKRDASFDDSQVGAGEHNANQINIANAIRAISSPPAPAPEGEGQPRKTHAQLLAEARAATQALVDWCDYNEACFTGYGDQIVPPEATAMTDRARSALAWLNASPESPAPPIVAAAKG